MTVSQSAKYFLKPPCSLYILDARLGPMFVKYLLRFSAISCFSTAVVVFITNFSGRSCRLFFVFLIISFIVFQVFFMLFLYFANKSE